MPARGNTSLLTLDRLRLAQTRNASAAVRSGAPRAQDTDDAPAFAPIEAAPRPTLAQVVRRLAEG